MAINSVNTNNTTDSIYNLIKQSSAGTPSPTSTAATNNNETSNTSPTTEQDVLEISEKKPSEIMQAMKADLSKNMDILRQMVQSLLEKQGGYAQGAGADFLLKVDKETQEWAQAQIAEDGYWGINKTAERILNFAKGISGGDTSKIDLLREGVMQGFNEAGKAWGGKLPEICQQTIDKVMEGFDEWAGITQTQE